ncbi:hypothetical protein PGT21_023635 [Puccinia graminis f. sp. tritici]|uniref:Uncharacterized protein n=1 Tax=Puccinia graminis f. sp. tritici TaxID=56615 RepID=A0A5B0QB72_PUCGR|nr:hypothetical protein PGT21_023635 [Puccinia graminis f. sp. tritici]
MTRRGVHLHLAKVIGVQRRQEAHEQLEPYGLDRLASLKHPFSNIPSAGPTGRLDSIMPYKDKEGILIFPDVAKVIGVQRRITSP